MILGIKSRKFRGISQDFVELVGFVPSYLNVGILNSLPYFVFFVDLVSYTHVCRIFYQLLRITLHLIVYTASSLVTSLNSSTSLLVSKLLK